MTVVFFTLGCKVNQYETQTLRTLFAQQGFSAPAPGRAPDVAVINSCTVTAESDRKTRQLTARLRRKYPGAVLIVTGCMPQARPEKADTLPLADIVTGNALNAQLPAMAEEFLHTHRRIVRIAPHASKEPISPLSADSFEGRTRAFVKIEDGCNRFCTYCMVPYARGRVRSKFPAEITRELTLLAAHGYREAVLAGINLSAYGTDCGLTLADAVRAAAAVPGIERIRLGSLEPDQLTEQTLDALAAAGGFCPQFHLSLQSGCDATLARMGRHYDTAFYRELCTRLRRRFPDCALTTDVMVGFPGETEEEFSQSAAFVSEIGFAKVHIFPYSRREGTPAAVLPGQIPRVQKENRARRMAETAERAALAFLRAQIGKTASVLFEHRDEAGYDCGYTENYTPVRCRSAVSLHGKTADVILTAVEENTLQMDCRLL